MRSLYKKLDKAILSNDIEAINVIESTLISSKSDNSFNEVINRNLIDLLEIFLSESILYHSSEHVSYEQSINRLKLALQKTVHGFDFDNFTMLRYNFLELRILLLIGLYFIKHNEIHLSTYILEFVLKYMNELKVHSLESEKLIIKLYVNISYNHHRLSQYEKSLISSEQAIKLLTDSYSLYCLPHLYARKAIAEYHLNCDNYIDSFKKALVLFEVLGDFELGNRYRIIAKNLYNIDL